MASRTLMMILWTGTMVAILGGIHYYLWARLVRDPRWPYVPDAWGAVMLTGLALLLPLTMFLHRLLPGGWSDILAWLGFVWMGFMFLFLVWFFSADVLRWSADLSLRFFGAPFAEERRLFLSRVVGGAAFVVAGGGGLLALRQGLSGFRIERVEVSLKRLPDAMRGFKIAQISDLHVGPTVGRAVVERLVKQTNALEPDLVAITGDLVDGTVERLRDAVAPLADLKARHGVYFVTGNHEYYSGVDEWILELERLGIRVLRNERVEIRQGDAAFDIAGVDDHTAHRYHPGHGVDFEAICQGRDETRELVLLAHQPKDIDRAARAGVGLQLSGHTHGGQIWPFGFLVKLAQPYVQGLHWHSEQTQIYVSCGTAYWGPPMRLGTNAELTELVLV